jgi:hypothetical protein
MQQVMALAEQHAMRAKAVRLFTLIAGTLAFERGEVDARTRAAKEQVAMLVEAARDEAGPRGVVIPRYAVLIARIRQGRVVDVIRVVSH